MNIYLDTEFIEHKNHLELISIELVKEDGECYYAISSEFDENKANEWVKANVISLLEHDLERKSTEIIKKEIVEFIGYQIPEIWAYFGSFDWVLLMWLYGGLSSLPYNFPMYYMELRQEIKRLKLPESLFPVNQNKHHAWSDAFWNKKLHQILKEFEKSNH